MRACVRACAHAHAHVHEGVRVDHDFFIIFGENRT